MSRFTLMQQRAIISAVAAVVVHAAVLVGWIGLIIWDLPLFALESSEKESDPEPEVIVVMRLMQRKPEPQSVTLPEPTSEAVKKMEVKQPNPELEARPEQKRRFARTSADQAGKPDEPTDILGERDTRAASELPADPLARPNTPSQDGVNPLAPGHIETVDRTHRDGSVGMDRMGEETEMPREATARKDNELVNKAPKVEAPRLEEVSSARPRNQHLSEGSMLPSSDGGEGKRDIEEKPESDQAPKEKLNEGVKKEGRGEEVDQEPRKEGFSGHSRKTRVTGSIKRRGTSALNVKNSPLGRYQARISKAVELQWRRNCEQHRDHVVPGVLSLRFYVDKNGRVSGIKFQDVVGANYIERGFTQRAIRQAKIPRMPKAVLRELDGEPLELIYNFYF